MELQTQQLRIIALDDEQFSLLIEGGDRLEKSLGVAITNEPLDANIVEALKWLYEQGLADKENFKWYTNWQIILKSADMIIGSANFLGKPDEDGQVELTFGLHKFGRLRGYEDEALTAICEWALTQDGVSSLIIEAEKSDVPALMIFERNKFVLAEEREATLLLRKS